MLYFFALPKSKPNAVGSIWKRKEEGAKRSFRRLGGSTAPRASPDAGTPRGIQTPDLLLRRQLLYPAELLAHIVPAANANNHQIKAQRNGFDLERRKEITDVEFSRRFGKPRKRNGVSFFRRWSG